MVVGATDAASLAGVELRAVRLPASVAVRNVAGCTAAAQSAAAVAVGSMVAAQSEVVAEGSTAVEGSTVAVEVIAEAEGMVAAVTGNCEWPELPNPVKKSERLAAKAAGRFCLP
jgi:hypothetical protein